MITTLEKAEKRKKFLEDRLEIKKFLSTESRYGCLYLLRKCVLEVAPPEKLRNLLKPQFEKMLKLDAIEANKLVSLIEDFILPEMTSAKIRKWIVDDASHSEMLGIIEEKSKDISASDN